MSACAPIVGPRRPAPRCVRCRADAARRRLRATAISQQRRDAGERQAQAALRALGGGSARVEEGALGRVELVLVAVTPLESDRQPRAAVDVAGVTSAFVPLARGVSEVAVHATPVGILLEPAAQPWPLAQQRFVGNLNRRGAHRQQTAVGERPRARGRHRRRLALEFCERDAPANDRAAGALSGQAEQQPSAQRPAAQASSPPYASSAIRATAPRTPPVRS